jgi:predicted RNase H-like HicB family nuclease
MATKRKRPKPLSELPYGQTFATFSAIFFDDGDGVSGFIEELLGVSAHGKDIREVRAKLTAATEEFIDSKEMDSRQSAYGTVTREKLLIEVIRKRYRPHG